MATGTWLSNRTGAQTIRREGDLVRVDALLGFHAQGKSHQGSRRQIQNDVLTRMARCLKLPCPPGTQDIHRGAQSRQTPGVELASSVSQKLQPCHWRWSTQRTSLHSFGSIIALPLPPVTIKADQLQSGMLWIPPRRWSYQDRARWRRHPNRASQNRARFHSRSHHRC